jgi:hypothetical protein
MLPGGLLAPTLAEGAQLVVVSGYTAGPPGAPVRVVLDQRGARLLLVLASYETVAWQLDVRPGTQLSAVVISAYRTVAVAGHGEAPAYRLALPCAPAIGSAGYADLMRALQARLGRSQPDVFRGYVRLPEQVSIATAGSGAAKDAASAGAGDVKDAEAGQQHQPGGGLGHQQLQLQAGAQAPPGLFDLFAVITQVGGHALVE